MKNAQSLKKILSGLALISFTLFSIFNISDISKKEHYLIQTSKAQEENRSSKPIKIDDPLFQNDKPSYVQDEIIVKLKEQESTIELLNQKYSKRNSKNKDVISKLKNKYKLKDERPIFQELHNEMRTQNASQRDIKNKVKNKFNARTKRIPQETQEVDLFPIYVLKTNQDITTTINNVKKDNEVEYAQPNYYYELQSTPLPQTTYLPNDHYLKDGTNFREGSWGQGYPDLWGIEKTQAIQAWDAFDINSNGIIDQEEKLPGQDVTVAVIDSGLDYNHSDIKNNVWHNTGEIPNDNQDNDGNGLIDDYAGYDFSDTDSDVMDYRGHGTHVSGTIAAEGNNEIGITGMAFGAKIMPVKVFPNSQTQTLVRGIQYAATMGADILNNSWGFAERLPYNPVLEDAINNAYALGSIIVFAAGNESDDVYYHVPQNLPNTIVVASTDYDDKQSLFSNYGDKIDVGAPGGDVRGWLYANYIEFAPDHKYYHTSWEGNYISIKHSANYTKDITLITAKGPGEGIIDIYENDVFKESIDLYSPERIWQTNIPLSVGPNVEIKIIVSGNKNPSSSGTSFIVNDFTANNIRLFDIWLREDASHGVDTNILSLRSDNAGKPTGSNSIAVGDIYYRMRGTSMAAPHVAGLAALILSARPEYNTEELRQAIRMSATDIEEPGWDKKSGYGRINTLQALQLPPVGEAMIRQFTNNSGSSMSNFEITAKGPGFTRYQLEFSTDDNPNDWKMIENQTNPADKKSMDFTLPAGFGKITFKLQVFNASQKIAEDRLAVPYDTVKLTNPPDRGKITDSPVNIIGSTTGSGFQSYRIEINSDPPKIINASNSRVENGILGTIDGSELEENRAYDLILKVQTASGEKIKKAEISVMKGMLPGWPVKVVGDSIYGTISPLIAGAPAIADIDNDGRMETVVQTGWSNDWRGPINDEYISIYRDDGSSYPGWPKAVQGVNSFLGKTPLIGDINDDKELEIVAASTWVGSGHKQMLYVWDKNGQDLPGWPIDYNEITGDNIEHYVEDILLGDINSDGQKEIIVFFWDFVAVLNAQGENIPGWPKSIEKAQDAALGDINNDGWPEIIARSGAATYSGPSQILVFNHDGNITVSKNFPEIDIRSSPVLGDIDNDGNIEIILTGNSVTNNMAIIVLDNNGNLKPGWPKEFMPTEGYPTGVSLTDINDDQYLEMILDTSKSSESLLTLIDWQGNVMPGWPKEIASETTNNVWAGIKQGAISGDLDGDGHPEILAVVVNSIDNQTVSQLYAWKPDGSTVDNFPKNIDYHLQGTAAGAPVLADLNHDGKIEIIFPGGDGSPYESYLFAYTLSAPYNKNKVPWPTVGHDPQQTNFYSNEPMLDKNCPSEAGYGQEIECTLTVINPKSWKDLTNVTIQDVLSSRLQFISADNNGMIEGLTLKWTLPSVARGEKKIFKFRARVL